MAVSAAGPVVGADEGGKDGAAGGERTAPVTDGVVVLVVDLEDRLVGPFA